ncbi:hypothetical protein [Myxosarcina sp. GI1]|uniref:hypothetical protein n=1 Tax=Myxosarcina sp. GI1 TaxID=1541065 RepID=UPI0006908334|nr:hypothetical protein [Myxosarcina sp. GI1]
MLFIARVEPKTIKFLTWSMVTILLGSLTGCGTPQVTTAEISRYKSGKIVYLMGNVTQSAPFIGNGAYQLNDETGSIWVVTKQKLPQTDRELAIKGEIQYQNLPVERQELGDFYLIELERLEPAKF